MSAWYSAIWRGVEESRSSPRSTCVTPMSASSTGLTKRVERGAVRAHDDEVAGAAGREGDRSAHEVVEAEVDLWVAGRGHADQRDQPRPRCSAGRSPRWRTRCVRSLQAEYGAGGRGIDLREVAEGWRLYSREDFAAYVERFVLDGQQARLTQAALETLAVIAYRQPVTRSRIGGIRGVSVDAVMRTLLTRGLVEECGADPDTGGGLYRTTRLFLEKVGLRSLDELPSLAPLLPDTSQLDDVAVST